MSRHEEDGGNWNWLVGRLADEHEDRLRARIRELEAALSSVLEMPHFCDAEYSPRSCSWCVVLDNARTALEPSDE